MLDMMDDFRFIFPTKLDKYKNVEKKSVKFDSLIMNYCMADYHEGIVDWVILLSRHYEGTYNGVVTFNNSDYQIILDRISNQIKTKMKHFNKMREFYYKIARENKKVETLIFSIRINDHQRNGQADMQVFKHFFNNIRSRSVFENYVIAYQWVILKDYKGYPYLHITFYLNDEKINNIITQDINSVWYNSLKRYGYLGEVKYLTISENFINDLYSYSKHGEKNMILDTKPSMYKDKKITDFNNCKYNLNSKIHKNKLIKYLYDLSKKSNMLISESKRLKSRRIIGFSSIK